MKPILDPGLQTKMKPSRDALDAWTRDIVQWHFNPETGCSFWLEYAKKLDWDPRQEIQGYEDLARFGPFQDEWLRGGPVTRWVPKAYADKPVYVFETGGSTGVPNRASVSKTSASITKPSATRCRTNIFRKAPTGSCSAHQARAVCGWPSSILAQYRGGICFMVDLDPRWVIKLLKMGQAKMAEAYKQHVVDQGLTLLRAHDNIKMPFHHHAEAVGSALRKSLAQKDGHYGVFCGGTEMTPQFHRFAVEELLDGVYFAPTYGNTLMGLATHKPRVPEDNYAIIYYPPSPRAMIEVVGS